MDGYHEESNEVLEFLGCPFHGCDISFFKGKSMKTLRLETQNSLAKLCNAGYNVISIWGCEWKRMMESDDEVEEHLKMIEPYLKVCKSPIAPREALYGGSECVKAVDFTSLYPFVMKYGKFPIGHPVIIRGPPHIFDYSLNKYFGLMRCRVLPPKRLFNPLLPQRFEVKSGGEELIFALCGKCASHQNFSLNCTHSVEKDRSRLFGQRSKFVKLLTINSLLL